MSKVMHARAIKEAKSAYRKLMKRLDGLRLNDQDSLEIEELIHEMTGAYAEAALYSTVVASCASVEAKLVFHGLNRKFAKFIAGDLNSTLEFSGNLQDSYQQGIGLYSNPEQWDLAGEIEYEKDIYKDLHYSDPQNFPIPKIGRPMWKTILEKNSGD